MQRRLHVPEGKINVAGLLRDGMKKRVISITKASPEASILLFYFFIVNKIAAGGAFIPGSGRNIIHADLAVGLPILLLLLRMLVRLVLCFLYYALK